MNYLKRASKFVVVGLFCLSHLSLKIVPAVAVSDSLYIYQLQTAGTSATQEFILLANSSLLPVDVTDWCIRYSSANDNTGFQSCIVAPDATTQLWVSAGGMISFSTNEFIAANVGFVPDVIFSSGMASTGGHVRLIDNNDVEIDKIGYGTAINPETAASATAASGKVLSRDLTVLLPDSDNNALDFSSQTIITTVASGLYEVFVPIDLCSNIDGLQETLPDGYLKDEDGECFFDVCPNLDELQITLPNGYKLLENGDCELIPLDSRTIFITELLPNAPSYDTGQEFIELYNPNNSPVDLSSYRLQIGPSFSSQYIFNGQIIPPNSYRVFSDMDTGIVLPNTSGVSLRLIAPAGNTVSQTSVYQNAEDDVSWAIVDDVWIYTNQITPAAANKPYLEQSEDEVVGITSVLTPCPAGKYRNPATNRCRTIETAVSQLAPCDEDEYRNPDTNRCRKVSSSSSTLAPCDEGEERNPETNRCRKVSVLGITSENALPDIQDISVENTAGRINWPILSATFLATAGYMLYEWRRELRIKWIAIRK